MAESPSPSTSSASTVRTEKPVSEALLNDKVSRACLSMCVACCELGRQWTSFEEGETRF